MSPTLFARMRIGGFNPSLARLVTLLLITLLLLAACSKEDDTETDPKSNQGRCEAGGRTQCRWSFKAHYRGLCRPRQVSMMVERSGGYSGSRSTITVISKSCILSPVSISRKVAGRHPQKVYFMIVKKERSIPELKDPVQGSSRLARGGGRNR